MSVEEKLECLREIRGYTVKISEMMVDIDTILMRISKDVRPKLETEVLTFPEMSELLSKGMIFNVRYEQALLVRAISSFQSGDYVRLTYEIPEYIRFLKTQESI